MAVNKTVSVATLDTNDDACSLRHKMMMMMSNDDEQ